MDKGDGPKGTYQASPLGFRTNRQNACFLLSLSLSFISSFLLSFLFLFSFFRKKAKKTDFLGKKKNCSFHNGSAHLKNVACKGS